MPLFPPLIGTTDLDQWGDAIYVSTDEVLHDEQGQEQLVFGVPHYGVLELGQSYTHLLEWPWGGYRRNPLIQIVARCPTR